MIGLVLKDIYTIVSQVRFIVIFLLLITFLQNDIIFSYTVFYVAMFPVTALTYDEQAKWHDLADVMPYTAGQIVGGKYVIGYVAVAGAAAAIAFGRFIGIVAGNAPDLEFLMPLALVICGALSLEAVLLPLMFWLGTERGRLAFVAAVAGAVICSMSILDNINFAGIQTAFPVLLLCAALLTICVNAVSYQISKILYLRRR